MGRLLLDNLSAEVFIETGTYLGESLDIAIKSNRFSSYYSIDCNKAHYDRAVDRYKDNPNVFLYHGHSADKLKEICPLVKKKRCLFWLDAHYQSGTRDEMIEEHGECPLLEELDVITSNIGSAIILIDDARMFFEDYWNNPSTNHYLFTREDWPLFTQIKDRLSDYDLKVSNDIIYCIGK